MYSHAHALYTWLCMPWIMNNEFFIHVWKILSFPQGSHSDKFFNKWEERRKSAKNFKLHKFSMSVIQTIKLNI